MGHKRKLNFEKRPVWCLKNGHTYTAIFNTSEGEIKVSLDTDRTPETVNNFIVLSRFKYYDDTLLFRFDPSLAIIQGGSPHTNDWSDLALATPSQMKAVSFQQAEDLPSGHLLMKQAN